MGRVKKIRPCRQMEEAHEGLQATLDPAWRGGVHGEIVVGGEVNVGDAVSLHGLLAEGSQR